MNQRSQHPQNESQPGQNQIIPQAYDPYSQQMRYLSQFQPQSHVPQVNPTNQVPQVNSPNQISMPQFQAQPIQPSYQIEQIQPRALGQLNQNNQSVPQSEESRGAIHKDLSNYYPLSYHQYLDMLQNPEQRGIAQMMAQNIQNNNNGQGVNNNQRYQGQIQSMPQNIPDQPQQQAYQQASTNLQLAQPNQNIYYGFNINNDSSNIVSNQQAMVQLCQDSTDELIGHIQPVKTIPEIQFHGQCQKLVSNKGYPVLNQVSQFEHIENDEVWEQRLNTQQKSVEQVKNEMKRDQEEQLMQLRSQKLIFNYLKQIESQFDNLDHRKNSFENAYRAVQDQKNASQKEGSEGSSLGNQMLSSKSQVFNMQIEQICNRTQQRANQSNNPNSFGIMNVTNRMPSMGLSSFESSMGSDSPHLSNFGQQRLNRFRQAAHQSQAQDEHIAEESKRFSSQDSDIRKSNSLRHQE